MKSDRSSAPGLEAALRAVDALDVETLRNVLKNVIHSVYNYRNDAGLTASVVEDLDGYDLLPYAPDEEEDPCEFVAWTDGAFYWHSDCIELDEEDVEFRGLTAAEATSTCHAEQVCDTCGLPLTEKPGSSPPDPPSCT